MPIEVPAMSTGITTDETCFTDLADDDLLSIIVLLSDLDVVSLTRTARRLRMLCSEVS